MTSALVACDGSPLRRDELRAVVTRPTAVVAAPGAAPLGAQLGPGFRLEAASGDWIPVHTTGAIAIDGWIPASARGWSWRVPVQRAPDEGNTFRFTHTPVHATRGDTAPVVAVLDGLVHVDTSDPVVVGTWIFVIAHTRTLRVEGYVQLPDDAIIARKSDFDGEVFDILVDPEGVKD